MKFHFKTYKSRLGFVHEELPQVCGAVLDVGNLGDGGPYASQIRKVVVERGGTYSGLDSNVNLSKKYASEHQLVGDLHAAPFPDGTFDVIYAGEIIEHTWDPRLMIRECHRILKPNGLLLLDTPNPFRLPVIARYLLKSEDDMGDNRELTYHEAKEEFGNMKNRGDELLQPQHKIFFTPAMMDQLLSTQGFVPTTWGCTAKGKNIVEKMLLKIFPQTGHHLCVVARKGTVDDAFSDLTKQA